MDCEDERLEPVECGARIVLFKSADQATFVVVKLDPCKHAQLPFFIVPTAVKNIIEARLAESIPANKITKLTINNQVFNTIGLFDGIIDELYVQKMSTKMQLGKRPPNTFSSFREHAPDDYIRKIHDNDGVRVAHCALPWMMDELPRSNGEISVDLTFNTFKKTDDNEQYHLVNATSRFQNGAKETFSRFVMNGQSASHFQQMFCMILSVPDVKLTHVVMDFDKASHAGLRDCLVEMHGEEEGNQLCKQMVSLCFVHFKRNVRKRSKWYGQGGLFRKIAYQIPYFKQDEALKVLDLLQRNGKIQKDELVALNLSDAVQEMGAQQYVVVDWSKNKSWVEYYSNESVLQGLSKVGQDGRFLAKTDNTNDVENAHRLVGATQKALVSSSNSKRLLDAIDFMRHQDMKVEAKMKRQELSLPPRSEQSRISKTNSQSEKRTLEQEKNSNKEKKANSGFCQCRTANSENAVSMTADVCAEDKTGHATADVGAKEIVRTTPALRKTRYKTRYMYHPLLLCHNHSLKQPTTLLSMVWTLPLTPISLLRKTKRHLLLLLWENTMTFSVKNWKHTKRWKAQRRSDRIQTMTATWKNCISRHRSTIMPPKRWCVATKSTRRNLLFNARHVVTLTICKRTASALSHLPQISKQIHGYARHASH